MRELESARSRLLKLSPGTRLDNSGLGVAALLPSPGRAEARSGRVGDAADGSGRPCRRRNAAPGRQRFRDSSRATASASVIGSAAPPFICGSGGAGPGSATAGEQLPPRGRVLASLCAGGALRVRLAGAPAGRRLARLARLRLAGRAGAMSRAACGVRETGRLAAVAAGLAAQPAARATGRARLREPQPAVAHPAAASGSAGELRPSGGRRDRRACPRGCRPRTRCGPPTADTPSSQAQGGAARSRGQPRS